MQSRHPFSLNRHVHDFPGWCEVLVWRGYFWCEILGGPFAQIVYDKCHTEIFFPFSWISWMCRFKWCDSPNFFKQLPHWKSFMPSWTILMWVLRRNLEENFLAQFSHWNFLKFSCTNLMCSITYSLCPNFFSQTKHWWSFLLSWTVSKWRLRA